MEKYTREIVTDLVFPHITVWGLFSHGEHFGYEVKADDGYVMYNPNANETMVDENGETNPYIYYCSVLGFPKGYNFRKFPYVAQKMV